MTPQKFPAYFKFPWQFLDFPFKRIYIFNLSDKNVMQPGRVTIVRYLAPHLGTCSSFLDNNRIPRYFEVVNLEIMIILILIHSDMSSNSPFISVFF